MLRDKAKEAIWVSGKKQGDRVLKNDEANPTLGLGDHWHNHMPWLYEKRQDMNGHHVGHPEFDPSTLKIPADKVVEKKWGLKITPAMKQWWDLKATHFDCILFFKGGLFLFCCI